jgi:hypothetical protein
MKNRTLTRIFAAGAAVLCAASQAGAQTVDALLDKLVDKGIITVKEAEELKVDSDKGFTTAYSVKSGMPEWVTSLKFYGDMRARYEGFYSEAEGTNGVAFADRNRFRYRLRFGVTAVLADQFEAGFRLSSSEPGSGSSNNEGDPISGNSTFQNNGSKKLVYIDQAYGRWYPLNGPTWSGALTVGKFENPFVFDDMVFDGDYTPEGAALQMGCRLSDAQALRLNAGGFVLDEFGSTEDPFLLAGQLRWNSTWNKELGTTLGGSALYINNEYLLTNGAVQNVNRGNTRIGATGAPAYRFNPWVVDGAVTYTLSSFPIYKGAFPIRISGAYMENPSAPSSADNFAWNAGITFGKSGKKGTWDVSYYYKWLGANSWFEELVDSDFGAFYAGNNAPANSGGNIGYASGTNVKGHILRLQYSPSDSVTLAAKCFLTELINPVPDGTDSQMCRLQVDANWKF